VNPPWYQVSRRCSKERAAYHAGVALFWAKVIFLDLMQKAFIRHMTHTLVRACMPRTSLPLFTPTRVVSVSMTLNGLHSSAPKRKAASHANVSYVSHSGEVPTQWRQPVRHLRLFLEYLYCRDTRPTLWPRTRIEYGCMNQWRANRKRYSVQMTGGGSLAGRNEGEGTPARQCLHRKRGVCSFSTCKPCCHCSHFRLKQRRRFRGKRERERA
jgi:hypothetical protein